MKEKERGKSNQQREEERKRTKKEKMQDADTGKRQKGSNESNKGE